MTVLLDDRATIHADRPRYEGANIRTWIGFKHFMYLVEEAVLAYFRERGIAAGRLYHNYGLGVEIVDSSVQLPATLELDDEVRATVTAGLATPGQGVSFAVQLTAERGSQAVAVARAKVRVALVALSNSGPVIPPPPFLLPYRIAEVAMLDHPARANLPIDDGQSIAALLTPPGSAAFLWSWRAPYYYCHFSDRLQHSGYVRALEEVVDRFLADRGISIRTMLTTRGWIPVVSRARVELLADAFMEETVHTVLQVEDVLKDSAYTARMDCYVHRGSELVHTATGSIMHGYAISRGPDAGKLAVFDAGTRAALLGGVR